MCRDRAAETIRRFPARDTTITDLSQIERPADWTAWNVRDERIHAAEKTVFRIHGKLIWYKIEDNARTGDMDYHLVIEDAETRQTMVVEIPCPECASGSTFPEDIRKVRATFDARFAGNAAPSGRFKAASVPVVIEGIGHFDLSHATSSPSHMPRGMAANLMELHPVLSLQFED